MNLSKHIKTSKKEALAFIRYMESCGFVSHNVSQDGTSDIHFSKDGETSILYAVSIIKGHGSFIMVRV